MAFWRIQSNIAGSGAVAATSAGAAFLEVSAGTSVPSSDMSQRRPASWLPGRPQQGQEEDMSLTRSCPGGV